VKRGNQLVRHPTASAGASDIWQAAARWTAAPTQEHSPRALTGSVPGTAWTLRDDDVLHEERVCAKDRMGVAA
jgi:hypothetical protein